MSYLPFQMTGYASAANAPPLGAFPEIPESVREALRQKLALPDQPGAPSRAGFGPGPAPSIPLPRDLRPDLTPPLPSPGFWTRRNQIIVGAAAGGTLLMILLAALWPRR